MSTLYQIVDSLSQILERAEEQGGELSDEDFSLLNELEGSFDEKGENIVKTIRSLLADAKRDREEAQFFQRRAQTAQKRAEWLKGYLLNEMEHLGLQKKQFGIFPTAVRTSPMPRVEVTDLASVPEKYTVTTLEVLKKDAIADHRKGTQIPGLVFKYGKFLKIG